MDESEQQFSLTSGPLRSSIIIELHTHHATQAWVGRLPNRDENIYGIIGIPRFITIMNVIRLDILADNPYADMWMLLLEERLQAAREGMNALIDSMQSVFDNVPEMMTVEGSASIKPARFPVFASTQLGFIAVYLLTDFDSLMRKALLAHHMALLTRAEMNELRQKAGNFLRSILVQAQKYRRIAVTRQDIREGNARAVAAVEQAGLVPEDILDGSRRAVYAPPLRLSDDSAVVADDNPAGPSDGAPVGEECDDESNA